MTTDHRALLLAARSQITEALVKIDKVLGGTPPVGTLPTPPVSVPTPDTGKARVIGVCVGHSRPGDSGAASVGNVTEWKYNQPIAADVVARLRAAGHDAILYDKYVGSSYSTSVNWIAAQLKEAGAEVAIELHFNAAAASAKGFEYLYWHASPSSKKLAELLTARHAATLPGTTNRGARSRTSTDRGAYYLQKTPCPSVILEPFFGSNAEEWEFYKTASNRLAGIYTGAVLDFLHTLP